MPRYDLIDFAVVLIGYALSGEPTLKAFYERLLPFGEVFMALSRLALDQATVKALRTLCAKRSRGTQAFRLSRWLVGSFRSALGRGGYRWNEGRSPRASASPTGV
jgi:hypothetical protein